MPLFVDAGFATKPGGHDTRLDAYRAIVPEPDRDEVHGALFAIADGIGERPDAEQAASDAVLELISSYYAAHEGWGLRQVLRESFSAANNAVLSGGPRGRAAALSALVLRSRRWAVAHAGNARAWLFREHRLKLLTRDHVVPRPRGAARVERACGLDDTLSADIAAGELAEGDIFLLMTDGAHNMLDAATIMSALREEFSAQQIADLLAERAAAAGSRDSLTVCAVRIEQLPAETNTDLEEAVDTLPMIAPPEVGGTIDGFVIQSLIHKSRRYRLYKAIDRETDQLVALKLPNPRYRNDSEFINSFLHEEWVGRRINSDYLVRFLPLRPGRRTALYSVMAHHKGENLSKRIHRKHGLHEREVLFLAEQLLVALDDLHRRGVIHRDVRPKNLLLDKANRRLLLIGLGSSHITNVWEGTEREVGRNNELSYLPPELLSGHDATARSDIYSAGVTLYHMLTGKYPYGKITAAAGARHARYIPITHWRTDLSPWLDEVLQRACAPDRLQRFASAREFADELVAARSRHRFQPSPATVSQSRSGPWGWLAIAAVVTSLLAYLLVALR